MRLIAEQAAGATDTFIQHDIVHRPSATRAPAHGRAFHLYCSQHNEGAEALLGELVASRHLSALAYTSQTDELSCCEAMLVYLTQQSLIITIEVGSAFYCLILYVFALIGALICTTKAVRGAL